MTARPLLGALLVLTVLGAGAHPEEPAAAKPAEKAVSCCQQMMQKQKDGLAVLESKATAMNAAQGAEKMDAIAAVVNELVAQHRGMHGEQGCPGGCSAMEKMGGMMGGGREASGAEHGGMQHQAPATGGDTP